MKRNAIPTFFDGTFHGFESMKEINRLKKEAHELAMSRQEDECADHMVYGYFSLDEDGDIETARLYSGVATTDEKFEDIASLKRSHIYAIHKRK